MTVRAVRYYDRLGLLPPSTRTEADQRLYTDADFARLQQILTLKLIGLSLNEIGQLLTTDSSMADLLERQKRVLRAQAAQLMHICETIEQAQAALTTSPQPDIDQYIEIIRAVTMHEDKTRLVQFLSDEQQQILAQAETSAPFADQRTRGLAWQALFADIRRQLSTDLHDPTVQALVDRWDTLVAQMTGNDEVTAAGLNRAYAAYDTLGDPATAPPEIRAWAQSVRDAAAFIQRARAARRADAE